MRPGAYYEAAGAEAATDSEVYAKPAVSHRSGSAVDTQVRPVRRIFAFSSKSARPRAHSHQ